MRRAPHNQAPPRSVAALEPPRIAAEAASQGSLPDYGPLPDHDEKLTAIVSVRCTPEEKSDFADLASCSGESSSEWLRSVGRQRRGMLLAKGKHRLPRIPRHELLDAIDAVRAEAAEALSDDRIDAGERARLTALISDQLDVLYQSLKRRKRA